MRIIHYLHHTLEVDIHGVWELEGLKVRCIVFEGLQQSKKNLY